MIFTLFGAFGGQTVAAADVANMSVYVKSNPITVVWESVEGAVRYRVILELVGETDIAHDNITGTSYDIAQEFTNLPTDVTYRRVVVKALDSSGNVIAEGYHGMFNEIKALSASIAGADTLGYAQVGTTLRCAVRTGYAPYEYEWYIDENKKPISEEASYTLQETDAGKKIYVKVTDHNNKEFICNPIEAFGTLQLAYNKASGVVTFDDPLNMPKNYDIVCTMKLLYNGEAIQTEDFHYYDSNTANISEALSGKYGDFEIVLSDWNGNTLDSIEFSILPPFSVEISSYDKRNKTVNLTGLDSIPEGESCTLSVEMIKSETESEVLGEYTVNYSEVRTGMVDISEAIGDKTGDFRLVVKKADGEQLNS